MWQQFLPTLLLLICWMLGSTELHIERIGSIWKVTRRSLQYLKTSNVLRTWCQVMAFQHVDLRPAAQRQWNHFRRFYQGLPEECQSHPQSTKKDNGSVCAVRMNWIRIIPVHPFSPEVRCLLSRLLRSNLACFKSFQSNKLICWLELPSLRGFRRRCRFRET
jgi:hypothetical protein